MKILFRFNNWLHNIITRFEKEQYGKRYFELYYDILDAISGCNLKEERLKKLFSYTRIGSNTY